MSNHKHALDKYALEKVCLGDGIEVWVQTTELPVSGKRPAADGQDQDRVARALAMVRPAARRLFETLGDINHPKQIEMELGIGFSGSVGVFLASADTDVTIKVKLTWENPAAPEPNQAPDSRPDSPPDSHPGGDS